MAQPTVIVGTKLLITVGDGANPETFSTPCGLTTRNFNLTASTNSTLLPDCDDPEAPAWEAKDVNSLSAEISGEGVMAVESFEVWREWFLSAISRNCKIELDHDDLGYFSGSFIISSLQIGGQRGQKVTINVTMVNDGSIVWTDNP